MAVISSRDDLCRHDVIKLTIKHSNVMRPSFVLAGVTQEVNIKIFDTVRHAQVNRLNKLQQQKDCNHQMLMTFE